MRALPVTPLEPVPSHTGSGMPRLFLKREDLLPYGGGNKVRRFVQWFEKNPAVRRVAVLSDRGSHTFWTLAQMLEGPLRKSALNNFVFLERRRRPNPYIERLRQGYSPHPQIEVRTGRFLWLWLQYLEMKFFSGKGTRTLGMGGSIRNADAAYAAAMEDCVKQLAEAGVDGKRVWHVFPIASGNMADSFLRTFRKANLNEHRIFGILTGARPARLWMKLKYRFEPRILIKKRRRVTWRRYERAARHCYQLTGIWLDPRHTVCAWRALTRMPAEITAEDVIVFWVTSPLLAAPDFDVLGHNT